jgi:hypothetical protein
MNSEFIKERTESWRGYMGQLWHESIDEFCETRTLKIDDIHKSWRYIIPLDKLSLTIEIVNSHHFIYKKNRYSVFMHKIPF